MDANHLIWNSTHPPKLLRLPLVEEITGVKKSTIYALMKAGQFPAPVKPSGARAVAWRSDEIADWVEGRVRANVLPVQL